MKTISVSYTLKWRFKEHKHIRVSECKKIFNIKTGRTKKICYNGGSLGIWITPNRFIIKRDINKNLEKIPMFEFI